MRASGVAIEIIVADGKQHRLTVTPSRVTLKILPSATDDEKMIISKFAASVVSDIGEVANSWRGKVQFFEMAGCPSIHTSLCTDCQKHYKHFHMEIAKLKGLI